MCDQRLRDGWIPDSENWPIVSSFFLSFLWDMGQSLWNPIRLLQSLCWTANNSSIDDHYVAAFGRLLAQHQRLPFPFLFSLARLTKQRFLGITSWAGHKEKREGKRETTVSSLISSTAVSLLFDRLMRMRTLQSFLLCGLGHSVSAWAPFPWMFTLWVHKVLFLFFFFFSRIPV